MGQWEISSGGAIRAWALLFGLVGLFCGSPAFAAAEEEAELREVGVQLKWTHQFQFAGYYAAIEQGYYRDAGLKVTLHERSESRSPIDQLMGGRVEFAVADTGALIYRSSGVPLVALAAIFQSSPSALMALDDDNVHSLSDLKGRRVMLSSGHMNAELIAMLANAGVTVDDFELVPSETSLDALTTKSVAAYNGYTTNEPYLLEQRGIPFKVFHPIDYDVDFYGDILLTTGPIIQSDPQLTRDFLDATRRGWEYAMRHPEAIVDLILRDYNTTDKSRGHLLFEARMARQLILPQVVPIGYMNRERWEHIEGIFRSQGLLAGDSDLDEFIYRVGEDRVLLGMLWSYRWYILLSLVSVVGAALLLHTLRLRTEVTTRTRQLSDAKGQAEVEARTDYLTGLPNRRHFLECLTRDIAQSERHNLPLALIMIDIDYFKEVNDQYGHAAGDEVLRRISEQLQVHIREGDVVARMGGEEFAVACLNTEQQEALALAHRLCRGVEAQTVEYDGDAIRVTVSIGLAAHEPGEGVNGLLRKSDLALYEAKHRGRNTVYPNTNDSMGSTS